MRPFHPASLRQNAVHDRLRDQLVACLPPSARIKDQGWRPWASASFAGARHWFDLDPHGAESGAFAQARLDERNWTLVGSIVADVAVHVGEPETDGVRIEFLVVDD